jgi:hypothetical protein
MGLVELPEGNQHQGEKQLLYFAHFFLPAEFL